MVDFLKRLEALEEIVKCNSITLTDLTNPNVKVVITFNNGELKTEKQETTTITETTITPLETINTNPE